MEMSGLRLGGDGQGERSVANKILSTRNASGGNQKVAVSCFCPMKLLWLKVLALIEGKSAHIDLMKGGCRM